MKIIVVCRWDGNHPAAFVMEQVDALRSLGHEVQYVPIKRGGMWGYVELLWNLRKAIHDVRPDIVHAHYGLGGFVANMQRQIPVVVTYPGSDINLKRIRPISIVSMLLSKYNLFMSKKQIEKVQCFARPEKSEIVRYGIMTDLFVQQDKTEARQKMGLVHNKKYVLFSSKFSRIGKDPELAKTVVKIVDKRRRDKGDTGVELLSLTGNYTKTEMASLINAVDAGLVTSKSEGSPQFTKEVMSCGCPIVSVDVGDVAEQVKGVNGCYIAKTREPEEIADLLEKAIDFGRTNGHQRIIDMRLDNVQVAEKLIEIYRTVTKK